MDTRGWRTASTRYSARRPHESGCGPPDPALPAPDLAARAGEHLQVPPELLRVCGPRDPQARRLQGWSDGRLAAAAVQPVVAWRGRLPVSSLLVIASIPGFSSLEHVMKSILDFFHSNVGLPWAWSIVAVTIVVRIALVPLTVRQIHSMQALQRHAPQMKEIQKKYKGDRQKLNEELMKFYRENNINPAASCLPLLAQFPIFIALYFTLRHFTKHVPKGADLSWLHIVPSIAARADSHWSGYLLLVIYAGSQILSTYFMSATMDKAQRAIMMVVPLVFITVIARFPAGLVLYWVTTNLWTVGQGLITRRLMPKTPAPAWPRRAPAPAKKKPEPEPVKAPQPAKAVVASPQQRRVKRRKKGGSRR